MLQTFPLACNEPCHLAYIYLTSMLDFEKDHLFVCTGWGAKVDHPQTGGLVVLTPVRGLASKMLNHELYHHWPAILQLVRMFTTNNRHCHPGVVQGTKQRCSTEPPLWLMLFFFSLVSCRSWSSSLRGNASLWRSRRRFLWSSWRSSGRSWPPNSLQPMKRWNGIFIWRTRSVWEKQPLNSSAL